MTPTEPGTGKPMPEPQPGPESSPAFVLKFIEPGTPPAPDPEGAEPSGDGGGDRPAGRAEEVPLLDEPRDGVPDVVDTPEALAAAIESLAAGTGPVAVDAERASGYRYGQRAFLVQLRREGAGTFLIDPDALRDLTALGAALAGIEWILHAASQDLPCLAELGMQPDAVFDTELAARLLNWPKVGLAAVVERLLGVRLAKEHSAVDWSTRPLPEPWLRYAALDVEVLIEARELMARELDMAGKTEWAREEFEAARLARPAVRAEPWRRLSGIHSIRKPRDLAVARALWASREQLAQERDVSPGRLLPDKSVAAAARTDPASPGELLATREFNGRAAKSEIARWFAAVREGRSCPEAELPAANVRSDSPPPPRLWADKDPAAAVRLAAAKDCIAALTERYDLPPENLLTPDYLRRLCWSPPDPPTEETVARALGALGARPWQQRLVSGPLSTAIHDAGKDRLESDTDG